MRILFADDLDAGRVAQLEQAGHQCRVDGSLTAETLPAAIGDAEALVVRSTKVTAATIAAGHDLGIIVRAGAGTDNIDKDAASGEGVYVCNVPGRNAIAVAELTMGLLLAIDRQIADGVADLRAGQWDKGRYTVADGLAGKTMAIVGLGEIGLAVAERAKAFGMTVQAVRKDGRSDSILARIRSIGIRMVDDEDALLENADIVSIHVPKSAETMELVNAAFLAKLQDRSIILNTSRGDMVNEAALIEALDQRGFRAGLDVYANEPSGKQGEFDSALASHPAVVGSHHIGASTTQAQESVADGTIEVLQAFGAGRMINCVNLVDEAEGSARLTVRHLDRVGVLAKILNVIGTDGRNVEHMENQLFTGGVSAVASINIDGPATQTLLDKLDAIEEVIGVSAGGD